MIYEDHKGDEAYLKDTPLGVTQAFKFLSKIVVDWMNEDIERTYYDLESLCIDRITAGADLKTAYSFEDIVNEGLSREAIIAIIMYEIKNGLTNRFKLCHSENKFQCCG